MATTLGALLLWVGWNNWRHRDSNAIPWIENKILNRVGEDPLPRTRFDSISRRIQAVLGLVFGLFFGGVGLLIMFIPGD
jgi:hypothetical protein